LKSWLCYYRSHEADELQAKHPNAFLLLCQIARRARLTPCPVTGLQIGQAQIGDYRQAGIQSERKYRTAKNTLKTRGFSTFKGTGKGTIATLLEQGIFSLSPVEATDTATGKRQASDRQATSKIECKNDTMNKEYICREIELPFSSDEFREAWTDWEQYRREIKKPLTSLAIKRQVKKIKAMGEAEAIAAIDQSISARYPDIYPPKQKTKPDHREAKARREYPEPSNPLPMLL
jgi:hypothetical protein